MSQGIAQNPMESLQHSSVSNTGALFRGKEEMELVHLVALSWNTEPKMLAAEGSVCSCA